LVPCALRAPAPVNLGVRQQTQRILPPNCIKGCIRVRAKKGGEDL
jgi:hypothetical protein